MAPSRSMRVILFCDLVASTALRARLGEDRADQWTDELRRQVTDLLVSHRGAMEGWAGDGTKAVFESGADALDAAIAIQRTTSTLVPPGEAHPAQMRVGIAAGEVSGAGGDVSGMSVVEAARLCAVAQPGTILCSRRLREQLPTSVDHAFSAPAAYELKGIPDPVEAVTVDWVPPNAAGSLAFPAILDASRGGPFVGRAHLLDDLLDEWQTRSWRSLVVIGEAGIGKTRVAAELARRMRASACPVVAGRCDQSISAPYRPWGRALSSFLQRLSPDRVQALAPASVEALSRLDPDLFPNAGRAVESSLDADTAHAVLVDTLARLLAEEGPLVAVIDDAHWADARSWQLFRDLHGEQVPGLTLIATSRTRPTGSIDARTVVLEGLDEASVAHLAAGVAADPDIVAELCRRTDGNPLYLAELLRHLGSEGAQLSALESLPDGVQAVVQQRVDALDPTTAAVLQVGAALGTIFDPLLLDQVLRFMAEPLDTEFALDQAMAAGLLIEVGSRLQFRHQVVRDAVHAGISPMRRRRIHRDIADVLEKRWAREIDRHLLALAHHHESARSPEAPVWFLRAAQQAAAILDATGAELADRGLALLAEHDTIEPALHCDLLISRAMCARLAPSSETLDDARAAFQAAVALGDDERAASALMGVSLRSAAVSQDDHVRFLRDGLAHLGDSRSVHRWEVEVALIVREFLDPHSDPEDHRRRVVDLVANLDPLGELDRRIARRCARSLTSSNQPREALDIIQRFGADRTGVDTEGFPVAVTETIAWLHVGQRSNADAAFVVAADDPRRSYWFYDALVLQVDVLRRLLAGRWHEASELLQRLVEIGGHDANILLSSTAQRSWLQQELGDVEANLAEIEALDWMVDDLPVLRAIRVGQLAEAGRHQEARAELQRLAAGGFTEVGRGWLLVYALANVVWAAMLTETDDGHDVLDELLRPYDGLMAVAATGTHVMCSVHRLRGALASLRGDHAQADHHFAAALAHERAIDAPPLVARTLHWWALAMQRRGEVTGAVTLFTAAGQLAELLEMPLLARQVADSLASTQAQ